MYKTVVSRKTYQFKNLKVLMAKATPLRSGDILAGVAAYSYDPQIKEQYRAFKFVTDIEKGSVQIYLNDTKVFEDSIDFQDTWKISVLLRGNASPKVNALRYLWIQYPKYIQLSK